MKIQPTAELLAIARRVVWNLEPQEALAQPIVFLSHVMTHGLLADVVVVRKELGIQAFREALENAPTGHFDARSWAYWNLLCDRWPAPPLPTRRL